MLATPHILTGAALAVATGNPYLGFAAAFVSHHLTDLLPHYDTARHHPHEPDDPDFVRPWDKKDLQLFGVDMTASLVILFFLFWRSAMSVELSALILVGAIGSIISDVWDNSPLWNRWARLTRFGRLFHRFHRRCHWKPRFSAGALITELFFTFAFIILPLYYLWGKI
ncbi:MAG: Uncharacterized protein CEN88_282 [Candidatus Berkelbacteria bacterium Licking1014_2]|uniref:Uncharacterized protein n=1 Tax=Candidatus Berkelbacteria bacterium Licking1014_2 TaxID=2017146 RepID=A0A554LV68_9BACT|nr:MAG: Uncharacterized protein CEN88_282 [Candidatus Berkelbacteria bacterium Licking1014_2]